MKRVVKWAVAAGVVAVIGCGCTSVRGVKPLAPSFGQVVDSVQPVLKWEAAPGEGVTYDLSIHEKRTDDTLKKVYSREGLAGTTHQVEGSALKPGTRYTWEVRTRQGEETGAWNRQEKFIFLLVYDKKVKRPFEFRTP
jgi:hypothetical protein